MFNRNRYLILASGVGILAIALLMLFYRHLALSTLVDHETRSNVGLTEVFSNSVWPRHRHLLTMGAVAGAEEIGRLDADVKDLMRGSRVVKVKVYDLKGLTVYASDPSQIGEDKSANAGFVSALAGEPASVITFRNQFDAFEGKLSDVNVVSSYIPIHSGAGGRIEAVFEVYSDVTDLMQRMQRVQWQIVVGVLGSVALIYGLLMRVARRADRIEAARREEAARSAAQLHYQAYHDTLTELPNRTSLQEQLPQAIQRAQRQDSIVAVLFLDIDRFKLVNDSFGHDAGDDLLRKIAARLRYCVRQGDTVFRSGGDEFIVMLEGLGYPEAALNLAQRILEAMQEPVVLNDQSFVSTVSIGISIYPDDDVDAAKLVKNADAALYLAKEDGRNCARFYTPELNRHALERLALESALQQALSNGEFVLHYQPRLGADGASVLGFEALLRWQRSAHELVPPGQFMPVLEQIGLINQVGRWVLQEACSQCQAWRVAGYPPVRISVNVSPRQFRERDFLASVQAALAHSGLDARYLELELTESSLLDDPGAAIATMQALKALGVSLSMDDFGTGYSSFSYLKKLPVDYLKIDRSFVRDLGASDKDAAIIAAIAGVAHSLGIGLVAEGVEQRSQVELLVAEGCQELQGFLFGRPVPKELAEQWLQPQTSRRAVAE
jgi:diguanylate cyclase (GGDEF)-like protein